MLTGGSDSKEKETIRRIFIKMRAKRAKEIEEVAKTLMAKCLKAKRKNWNKIKKLNYLRSKLLILRREKWIRKTMRMRTIEQWNEHEKGGVYVLLCTIRKR